MMIKEEYLIKVGDYIVVQRQNFTKLHKLKSNGTISLGKDQVELENVIGKPFYTTFRMVVRPNNKRVYTLEEAEYVNSIQNLSIDKSGNDNRGIVDDGRSQQLSTEEISKFRDEALSSSDIVEKLITNSTTFSTKTEYSQEKYLKKKEKKYFEYIQIRKPSVRLIAEIYYRQEPGKVLGIRADDLSQIVSYSNVQASCKVLLYDSGTSGLLPAALTSAIGSGSDGILVHMHPGNVCQKEAFQALHFPQEQSERCINVCLYSVLRCFYQEQTTVATDTATTTERECKEDEHNNTGNKRKYTNSNSNSAEERPAKRACWQIDNERACKVLANQVDSLIVAAKEHPNTIIKELLVFLKDGSPLTVYSLLRESLESLYLELKNRTDIINLRLSNTMLRNYQVLPNRTHPDVNMTCGGYILTGFKVCTKSD